MDRRLGVEADAALDGAAFRVGSTEIEPPDPCERNGGGAHGAWFQRHVEVATGEPFGGECRGGVADCDHFRMSGRVEVGDGAVAGRRDDLAVPDDHRTDRHFAALARRPCLGQREFHERHEG